MPEKYVFQSERSGQIYIFILHIRLEGINTLKKLTTWLTLLRPVQLVFGK